MDFNCLPEYLARTRQLLFAEGHLNENFVRLENFEKVYNMEFFVEVAVYNYCEQSALVITKLEQQLEKTPLNFVTLEYLLNLIRKHTISFGANHVVTKVNQLRQLVIERSNTQSCQNAFKALKLERERFVSKMVAYVGMFRWQPPCEIDVDDEAPKDTDED